MNDSNKKENSGSNAALEKFGLAMLAMMGILSVIAWTGLKRIKIKSVDFVILFPTLVVFLLTITFADYAYLKFLNLHLPNIFSSHAINILMRFPCYAHFLVLSVFSFYWICVGLGILPYIRKKKLQKDLDSVGLSNAQGVTAKVIRDISIDENKTKLLITAKGIGLDRFEAKKGDLEASFQQIVEGIRISQDRKTVEILLCKKELRKIISFYEAVTAIKNPYTFLVGESANGILIQDIRDLPHLLIAGTTGHGKSTFFKQLFLCLLKFGLHIQVYLIDLKRGVEVKEFGQVPNVRIAKDEAAAVQLLQHLRDEMQRRFEFMEKHGIKKIDPKLHKKDLIVVGVDEASVLYGKTSVSKAKSELVAKARDLTDELAKLGRAAGIHLVIATQKAIKESLDTKVLENLTGRMIFKMTTHAGSNTALGNVKAYSLPDIKGRGIWAGGNQYVEIQTPFMTDAELDDECKELAAKLNEQGLSNFQPMIEFKQSQSAETNAALEEIEMQAQQTE